MKKRFITLFTALLLLSLTACGNSPEKTDPSGQQNASTQPEKTSGSQASEPERSSSEAVALSSSPEQSAAEASSEPESGEGPTQKALIVYFSWSGNTESVANAIASQTGADVFRLEPVQAYSTDYNTVLDVARDEQRNNARPAFSGSIDNLAEYSVIYLGYPNWWGDLPMILYTFLDTYDLSGKTIAPFVTSGGSGFSDTLRTIRAVQPNATVLDGLSLNSSEAADPDSAVSDWLAGLKITE